MHVPLLIIGVHLFASCVHRGSVLPHPFGGLVVCQLSNNLATSMYIVYALRYIIMVFKVLVAKQLPPACTIIIHVYIYNSCMTVYTKRIVIIIQVIISYNNKQLGKHMLRNHGILCTHSN